MNEEKIRDEARKAANGSQFNSNYPYDHKSYEDGFYDGMKQALRQPPVSGALPPEKIDELIKSIYVNRANFEFIAQTGSINGSLLQALRRLIAEVSGGNAH